MNLESKKDYFSMVFNIGMLWRIIYGTFKLVLGIFLLNFIDTSFSDLFYNLVGNELIEDPNDFLITTISSILDNGSMGVSYFVASYFIFWGALDVFLSVNLLRLKIWAYPLSLFLITLFTVYEAYRFTHTYSLILLSVIGIDIFIIWMINKEYIRLKNSNKNKPLEENLKNI